MWRQLKCLILLTIFLWYQKEAECGLHVWNNTMYFFAEPTDRNLTWYESRSYCQSLNMHLIRIETFEENVAIKDIIKQNYDGKHYYMDGTDEGAEGRWFWKETGERIQCFDWHVAEPNLGTAGNYMIMYKLDGIYAWHDIQNDWLEKGILALCEQPVTSRKKFSLHR